MPKVVVAERILETVTTSDRADSIVGDLLEETSNPVWFWLAVLRIIASHLFRDLRVHWFRMIWIGLSGFLELFILAALVAYCWNIAQHLTGHSYWGKILISLGSLSLNVLGYGIPTLVGWHSAKRSHGNELASAVAVAFVYCIFVSGGASPSQVAHVTLVVFLLLVGGAFMFRYRANKRNLKLPG